MSAHHDWDLVKKKKKERAKRIMKKKRINLIITALAKGVREREREGSIKVLRKVPT